MIHGSNRPTEDYSTGCEAAVDEPYKETSAFVVWLGSSESNSYGDVERTRGMGWPAHPDIVASQKPRNRAPGERSDAPLTAAKGVWSISFHPGWKLRQMG